MRLLLQMHTHFAFLFPFYFCTTEVVNIPHRLAGVQMIVLNNYHIVTKNDRYYVVSKESSTCPVCQGPLKVRDSKMRKVILSGGEVRIFHLRRLKCIQCGVLHVELPDLFVPHKHYSRNVIEMALVGSLSNCPAENSTIYRWSKERSEKNLT